MSDSRNASEFKTIATIMVSESEGLLLVKPITEEVQTVITSIVQSVENSTAIRVPANGHLSIRKIVELLNGLQEQDRE